MRTLCWIGLISLVASCRTPDSPARDPRAEQPDPTEAGPATTAAPPPPAVPTQPVATAQSVAAHQAVQQTMHGGALPENPLVRFTAIEDRTGRALSKFHTALRRLAAGQDRDGKVRVAVYGSSSVAADRYTGYMRGYLQHRFGDGGIGFIATVPLWRWHRHNAVTLKANRYWTIEHAQKKKERLDGHYGLLGASATATSKRATTLVRQKSGANTSAEQSDQIELYFLTQPQGGTFRVTAGRKGQAQEVSTRGETLKAGYSMVESPALPLKIAPRGDGEVRLFGAALERQGPGVVVDCLGIGGTRAANHLDWNVELWQDGISRRTPDLYILAYGANEAVDEDEPIAVYQENLEAVLDRFAQTLPNASCVLIGPWDFPVQDDAGKWIVRPRMLEIVKTQREVALTKGCGFWDGTAFMGGVGSMDSWVTAQPPLAKADHLHLSKLGYLYVGRNFIDALMAGYDVDVDPAKGD